MKVQQFEYEPLSHYSYALVSEGEMVIIDPERNPMQYYAFAKANNARIIAVIETHPHADFVSSHLQIHQETGADIYCSEKLGADYPHKAFDEGDSLTFGKASLSAINTPGHSPDSITIVATEGKETLLFTGDTLLIGDVGRPDLRENAGNRKSKRQELAQAMYHTVQHKFQNLPDDAIVYPAHGAGSLCGKSQTNASSSTLGNERKSNWAFQEQTQEEFVDELLDSQPFVPSYFGFNVDLNKKGADVLRNAIATVPFKLNNSAEGFIVDVRRESDFKKGHLKGSINIQASSEDAPFETWLGAIIKPEEKFSLVIEHPEDLERVLERVAKIGYEQQLQAVLTPGEENLVNTPFLDLKDFKNNPDRYTIVDIRNKSEVSEGKIFDSALSHPLNELRETASSIPTSKPIVAHCGGGYRSAAGSSILACQLDGVPVFDLSDDVTEFKE